jgi:glycosyltransferase involved in cell wall biosynthesis
MPAISVIVPVYKVEKYIHRCVDSVLAQTFTDFELILIDDGSPDSCGAICDWYADKDNRVRVIHQENGGLSAARNAGLDVIEGRFVTFIDSDDYVYPKYLEYLYYALIENKAEISVCGMVEFNEIPPSIEDRKPSNYVILQGKQVCEKLCDYQTANGLIAAWGKLFKSEIFTSLRFPIGKIHEDQFTMHKAIFACRKVVILEETLYGYFINLKGITKSGFSLRRYDNVEAMKENAEFYRLQNEEELAYKAERLANLICSMFSVYAREAGIYKNVPSHYRIGLVRAGQTIRKELGYDVYEWHMAKVIPYAMKIQAYVRKLLSLIG